MSAAFSLRTFGGVCIENATGPLRGPIAQRRRLALLAVLAASPTGGVGRERLVGYFWPDVSSAQARDRLTDAVHALRKVLGRDALLSVGSELRLDPAHVRSDVAEFNDAVEAADWPHATALYRGPFLDGFSVPDAPEFGHWLDGERERLARSYGRALAAMAAACEAVGDVVGAVNALRMLAAHDPCNSGVALRLMQALAAAGDRAGALRQAQVHQTLLQTHLEVEPDADVAALAERLRHRASPPRGANGTHATARSSTGPNGAHPPNAAAIPTPDPVAAGADSYVEPIRDAAAGLSGPALPPVASVPRGSARRRVPAALATLAALAILALPVARVVASLDRDVASPATLVVLPLKNHSGEDGQDFLADGLTEELITTLGRIDALRVIAHQSVVRFRNSTLPVPEIARTLGADYVVDGAIMQADDRIRITVSLVEAASSRQLWTQRYERQRSDLIGLQQEVALAIAQRTAGAILPRDLDRLARTARLDPDAFDLYLRGRQAWARLTTQGYLEAAAYFSEVLERAPDYAPAYAGLAAAHVCLWNKVEAKRYATRALELDPDLEEAWVALGLIRMFFDLDYAGAEAAYHEAIRLNPGYAAAHFELALLHMRLGRARDALTAGQYALYLAPVSPTHQGGLAEIHVFAGRVEEALAASDAALELDPSSHYAWWTRGLAQLQRGRYDEAVAALRTGAERGCGDCVRHLGYAYAAAGHEAEARNMLAELHRQWEAGERGNVAFDIGLIHAGFGQHALALNWLEQGLQPGRRLLYLGVDPALRSLHDEPRFRALLRQARLESMASR